MYSDNDTICAISTPPGVGGIAVIRISGPNAMEIADSIWKGKRLTDQPSHTTHLGNIEDPADGSILDHAVASLFRAPASFTGENIVELSVHGSIWIQNQLINLLIRQGCRLAEPGEFTRRAFASGKMDLAEAEAVADVIAATSRTAHHTAMSQMRGQFSRCLSDLRERLLELASLLELELDFSEEDVEFADRDHLRRLAETTLNEVDRLAASFSTGDAIRRGVPVAIIGRPNAGKSSILNQLLNDSRAIVSDIPGTTRDTIEDTSEINGITFRFIDTAGLRTTSDIVENLGIERTWEKAATARIIILVADPTDQSPDTDIQPLATTLLSKKLPDSKIILAINKTDLTPATRQQSTTSQAPLSRFKDTLKRLSTLADTTIELSAKTGNGLDTLKNALVTLAVSTPITDSDIIVTNARHYEALTAASASLKRVIASLTPTPGIPNLSGDFIAQDVRETIHHLSTITGAISTPDILATIFSRFCIGK